MPTKLEPILKWPGGKRRVLKEITRYIPSTYSSYYEPFIGGGAVYFGLQPASAVISDVNEDLINLYTQVKNNPEALIAELSDREKYLNTHQNFLTLRALDRDNDVYRKLSEVEKAARIIYLNKTCFNGLYRVNSKGQFNVPYGKYANPRILNENLIRSVHEQFNKGTKIIHGGYREVLTGEHAPQKRQNFIYMDPPYIPLSSSSSFTSYAKDGFNCEDQEDVRNLARELDETGNYVLLSNSDTPLTRELYADFVLKSIKVTRSISHNKESRVQVGELLILGRTLAGELGVEPDELPGILIR